MALGTNHESSTTLAIFEPAVWGSRVNDIFRQKLMLTSLFIDRSDEVVDGGTDVYTPNITEMSANNKSNGSQITLNNPTETKQDLAINTWKEVSFLIEDKEAAQVKGSYEVQKRYASNAAYTLARTVENAVGALFSGLTSTVGASTTTVADSDIRKAIGLAMAANLDKSELAFVFDSAVMWNQVMGIDRFTLYTNTGNQNPVSLAEVGRLYNIPVVESNSVPYVSGTTGRYNALIHKDAIHYAFGNLPGSKNNGVRVQSQYKQEYLGELTTADVLYGVLLNRATAGVAILTQKS